MEGNSTVDVCVLGGGLAGLTLARQLKRAKPELDVAVVEHRGFPVPEAAHKVGESTVEIAAHYLGDWLGLRDHLTEAQLPKNGLRFFMRGDEPITDDMAQYDEIGASRPLSIPTYQIDRGRLENHLADCCQSDGTALFDRTTVRSVDLGSNRHRVTVRNADGGAQRQINCRYIADATGRRAWLRRAGELTRASSHHNAAVWFRVPGDLCVDDWTGSREWQALCTGLSRRLSTVHFCGRGYWLWLIPLASNSTSVGLVFDPSIIPIATVSQHDKLLRWVAEEHPIVAAKLADLEPLDFHVLEQYAVGSRRVFSDHGWMTTGDAGVFADPLYSPGSDFIAFTNSYITELIAGEQDPKALRIYQAHFFSFYDNTLSLYDGLYAGFGNRNLMVAKTVWDFAYYWGVLAKLFFTRKFLDLDFMAKNQRPLALCNGLNREMQSLFRDLGKSDKRVGGEGLFYNYCDVDLFHEMIDDLASGDPEDAATRLNRNVSALENVAAFVREIVDNDRRGIPARQLGAF